MPYSVKERCLLWKRITLRVTYKMPYRGAITISAGRRLDGKVEACERLGNIWILIVFALGDRLYPIARVQMP